MTSARSGTLPRLGEIGSIGGRLRREGQRRERPRLCGQNDRPIGALFRRSLAAELPSSTTSISRKASAYVQQTSPRRPTDYRPRRGSGSSIKGSGAGAAGSEPSASRRGNAKASISASTKCRGRTNRPGRCRYCRGGTRIRSPRRADRIRCSGGFPVLRACLPIPWLPKRLSLRDADSSTLSIKFDVYVKRR